MKKDETIRVSDLVNLNYVVVFLIDEKEIHVYGLKNTVICDMLHIPVRREKKMMGCMRMRFFIYLLGVINLKTGGQGDGSNAANFSPGVTMVKGKSCLLSPLTAPG